MSHVDYSGAISSSFISMYRPECGGTRPDLCLEQELAQSNVTSVVLWDSQAADGWPTETMGLQGEELVSDRMKRGCTDTQERKHKEYIKLGIMQS